jgi:hypothetical protein
MVVILAGAPGSRSIGTNVGGGQPASQSGLIDASYNVTPGQTISAVAACPTSAPLNNASVPGSVGWSNGGSSTDGGGAGGGSSAVCLGATCTDTSTTKLGNWVAIAGGGGGAGGGNCTGQNGWMGGGGGSGSNTVTSYYGYGPNGASGIAARSPWGTGGANDYSSGNGQGSSVFPINNGASPKDTGNQDWDMGGGGGAVGGQVGNDWIGKACGSQGGGGGGLSWVAFANQAGTPSFSTANSPEVVVDFATSSSPTIAGLYPTSGPASGGTAILISGTNLGNLTSIYVGGNKCLNMGASAVQVYCITSSGSPGPADVSVTSSQGNFVYPAGFTYQ